MTSLFGRHQALDGQDARVEQCDVDALAAVAVAPEGGGSGELCDVGHVAGGAGRADARRLQLQPAVLRDGLDGGDGAQAGHGRGRDVGDQGAERVLGGDDGAAERGRGSAGSGEAVPLGLDDDADVGDEAVDATSSGPAELIASASPVDGASSRPPTASATAAAARQRSCRSSRCGITCPPEGCRREIVTIPLPVTESHVTLTDCTRTA